MLIHSFEEFFRLHRLFEVTFYKITFGQKTQTTNTWCALPVLILAGCRTHVI